MRVHTLNTHASPFSAQDLLNDEVYFNRRLGVPVSILFVCKKIYIEAIDILYQNTFLVDIDYRRAVLSQSSATVLRLWKRSGELGPSPVSIPPEWQISRITRLHLRIEFHRQGNRIPAQPYHFCYPDLGAMHSLNTLEVSVLYTTWSEKWRGRSPYRFAQHHDAMSLFRGEAGPINVMVKKEFTFFMNYLIRSIPQSVKTVIWRDDSEGWRPKNMGEPVEPGTQFLKKQSPSVKTITMRGCAFIKKEVLERAAKELETSRGDIPARYLVRAEEIAKGRRTTK